MLDTRLVEMVLLRSETVGSWIVERLEKPDKRAGVVEYLSKVSIVAEANRLSSTGATKSVALTRAFVNLPNLLPAMLQLPEEDIVSNLRCTVPAARVLNESSPAVQYFSGGVREHQPAAAGPRRQVCRQSCCCDNRLRGPRRSFHLTLLLPIPNGIPGGPRRELA